MDKINNEHKGLGRLCSALRTDLMFKGGVALKLNNSSQPLIKVILKILFQHLQRDYEHLSANAK